MRSQGRDSPLAPFPVSKIQEFLTLVTSEWRSWSWIIGKVLPGCQVFLITLDPDPEAFRWDLHMKKKSSVKGGV